jgi:hypothetical protein
MDEFGLNSGMHLVMLPELMHGKFPERLFNCHETKMPIADII